MYLLGKTVLWHHILLAYSSDDLLMLGIFIEPTNLKPDMTIVTISFYYVNDTFIELTRDVSSEYSRRSGLSSQTDIGP